MAERRGRPSPQFTSATDETLGTRARKATGQLATQGCRVSPPMQTSSDPKGVVTSKESAPSATPHLHARANVPGRQMCAGHSKPRGGTQCHRYASEIARWARREHSQVLRLGRTCLASGRRHRPPPPPPTVLAGAYSPSFCHTYRLVHREAHIEFAS